MPTLVANVRVFDGERVADANSVLWEGARITAVGRDLPAPDRGEVIDARGKTLLPGLIDAHVHTPDALDRAEAALRQSLESGVTTALCMGTFTPATVAELKARDRTDLADLRSAGNPATVRGSHPSQLYPGDYPHALRHVAEVPPFIANRLREGSDYIKIMIEDSSLIGGNTPRMSPELSKAVTSEAHAHGLLVIAHAQTRGFVEQALESGVDGLAHQFVDQPLTADFARLLGDAGVFVVPTLAVYHSAEGRTSPPIHGWPLTSGTTGSERSAPPSPARNASSVTASTRSELFARPVYRSLPARTPPTWATQVSPTAQASTTSSHSWCAVACRRPKHSPRRLPCPPSTSTSPTEDGSATG